MESRRAAPRRTLPANAQRSTRSSSRVSAAAPPLRAGRASSFVRPSRLGSAETDEESAGREPPARYALVPSSRTRVSHVLRRAEPEELEEEQEYAQDNAAYEQEPEDGYDGMSEQDRTTVPRYSTARQRLSSSRTGGATSFAENAASSPPAVSPRKRPADRAQASRLSESVRPASRNAYSARVAQELLRPRMSAAGDARRPDAALEAAASAARRPRATMPSRERNGLYSEQDRSLPRPTQTSASFASAVERLRGGRSSGAGGVSGRAPSGRGDISGNQSVVSFAPDSSYVRRRSQLAASEGRSTSRATSVAGAPRLRRSLVGDDGQIHEPSLAERCGALETNASKLLSFYAGLVQDGAKSGSVAEMRRCWDPFHSYKTNQLLAEGQYHNHFIDASAVRSASLLEDPPEYFDRSLALANRATFVHYVYGVPANASSADLGTGGYTHRSLTELLDARRVFLAWIVPPDVAITDDVLALHLDLCTQVYLARRRADRALPRAARKRAIEHRDDSLSAEAVRAALLRARISRQMRSAEVEEIVARFEQLARARVFQIESLDDDVELMAEEWPLRGTAVDMARFVGYLDAPGQPQPCSSSLDGLLDDLARMSADGRDVSEEVVGSEDLRSGSGSVLIDDEEASALLARQSTPRGLAAGTQVESDLEVEEDVWSEAAESVFKDAETGSPAASSQQDLDSLDLQKLEWLDELAQEDGTTAAAPAKRRRVAAPASKPLAVPIADNSQLSSLLDLTASQKLQELNGLALDDTAVIFGSSVAELTPRASIALTAQKVIQQMGESDAAAGSPAAAAASLAGLDTPKRQEASRIMAQMKAQASRRSIGAAAASHEQVAARDTSDEDQLVNGGEAAAAGSPAARLRFDSQKRIVRTNEPAAASILAAGKGTGVRLDRFDEDDEEGNIFLEAPRKQAKTSAAARAKSKAAAAAAGERAESELDAQSTAGRTRRTTRAQSSRQASAVPGTPRHRAQARGQASASKGKDDGPEDAAYLDQPEMPAFDEMPEIDLEEERGRNDGGDAPFVDEVDENLPPPNGQRSFRRSGVRASPSPPADFEADEADVADANALLTQSRKRRRAGHLRIPAPRVSAGRSQDRAADPQTDLLHVSSDGSSEGEYVVEELGPRRRGKASVLLHRRKRRGYDAPGGSNASVPVIADDASDDDEDDDDADAAPTPAVAPRKSTRGELIGSGAGPVTRTRARAAEAAAASAGQEGDGEQQAEADEPPPPDNARRSTSRVVSRSPARGGRPATQTRKIVRYQKNARKYIIGKGHSGRRAWTEEEEDVFMDVLNQLSKHKKKSASYPIYAKVLELHGPDGSESEALAHWNNVQLKDKARNILIKLQRNGQSLPSWGKLLHPTLWEPKPDNPRSRTREPHVSGSEEEDDDEILGASDEEYTPRKKGHAAVKRSQQNAGSGDERASAAPAGGADGAADDDNVDAGAESESSVAAVESQIPSTAG